MKITTRQSKHQQLKEPLLKFGLELKKLVNNSSVGAEWPKLDRWICDACMVYSTFEHVYSCWLTQAALNRL